MGELEESDVQYCEGIVLFNPIVNLDDVLGKLNDRNNLGDLVCLSSNEIWMADNKSKKDGEYALVLDKKGVIYLRGYPNTNESAKIVNAFYEFVGERMGSPKNPANKIQGFDISITSEDRFGLIKGRDLEPNIKQQIEIKIPNFGILEKVETCLLDPKIQQAIPADISRIWTRRRSTNYLLSLSSSKHTDPWSVYQIVNMLLQENGAISSPKSLSLAYAVNF